jgi:FkbM family methyltransferase
MSLRSTLKSLLPSYLLETIQSQKQLAPVYGGSFFPSWFAALSPGKHRALEQSRVGLLPASLRHAMDMVVDIGANEGQWIASLLDLIPVQQTFVIEPNPAAMQRCKQRLRGRTGITFSEVALGSRRGSAILHVTKSSDFSSLLIPNHQLIDANYGHETSSIVSEHTVEVVPLDDLLPAGEEIDLMKLDVQGFEREVLAGSASALRRTRAVVIETNFQSHYSKDSTFDALFQLFTQDLGFSFWNISDPFRGNMGQSLWADSIFINLALVSQDSESL